MADQSKRPNMTLSERATARYLHEVEGFHYPLKEGVVRPRLPIIAALFSFSDGAIARAIKHKGDNRKRDPRHILEPCKRRDNESADAFKKRIQALAALPILEKAKVFASHPHAGRIKVEILAAHLLRDGSVSDSEDDSTTEEEDDEVRVVSERKSESPAITPPRAFRPKRPLSYDSDPESSSAPPRKRNAKPSQNEFTATDRQELAGKGKGREVQPLRKAVAPSSVTAPVKQNPSRTAQPFSPIPNLDFLPQSPVSPVSAAAYSRRTSRMAAPEPVRSSRRSLRSPQNVHEPEVQIINGSVSLRDTRQTSDSVEARAPRDPQSSSAQSAMKPIFSAGPPLSKGPALGKGTQDVPATDLVTWLRGLSAPLDKHLGIFETMGIHSLEEMRLVALTSSEEAATYLFDSAIKLGMKHFEVFILKEGLAAMKVKSRG